MVELRFQDLEECAIHCSAGALRAGVAANDLKRAAALAGDQVSSFKDLELETSQRARGRRNQGELQQT
jgi:hypothetical protein